MSAPTPRHLARLATLVFVTCGEDVLLLCRPSGKRFAGLWNGVGGHVEVAEDVMAAARRELLEEAGLELDSLRLAAVSHEHDGPRATLVFLFTVDSVGRELRPAPGLELAWHPRGRLSELELVPDLAILLPAVFTANQTLFSTVEWKGTELVSVRLSGRPSF